MSLYRKIGLGIAFLLLLLLGSAAYLIGTASGLHLLLNGAARWVPGLDIASVSGGWRDLTIKGLNYEAPGIKAQAGQFHLSLNFSCLRRSQLCVNALSLSDVTVNINTAEQPTPTTAPEPQQSLGTLSTPYPVLLHSLTLRNIQVHIDNTTLSLAELHTGMEFRDNNLVVTPTRIAGLVVALPKAAAVVADKAIDSLALTEPERRALEERERAEQAQRAEALRKAPPLSQTLQALFAKPLLPELPNISLPLNVEVRSLIGEEWRLTGDIDVPIHRLAMRGSARDRRVTLEQFAIEAAQGSLNASGNAQLEGQWPLSLTVNTQLLVAPVKGEKIKLKVGGSLRDELTASLNLSGPVRTQLDASTRLAQAGLPLRLSLTSPGLQWPLAGRPLYQVKDLSLKLDGQAVDYGLNMRASLRGEGMPPAEVTLDGRGHPTQFTLSRLRVAALEGNSDLTAVLDWSNAVSWRSELTLAGINTARQWPDWPARLDGKITTRGSLYGGNWQLSIPEMALNGNVKKNALTLTGSLEGNAAGQWHIPGVRLALGRNNLTVKGELNDRLALDAVIDAPNLNGALPGLGGTVRGTINVSGVRQSPQLRMDLAATALRWQELSIRRVTLAGQLGVSDIVRGNLHLLVEELKQGSLAVSQLRLTADGDERRHRLQLNIQGEPLAGALTLIGGYDRQQQRWRGALSQTHFTSPVGEWRLSRDMSLDYQNALRQVTIGQHCWLNPNAQLCVSTPIVAGASGRASLLLNRFDLAMLKSFLPEQTALQGVFSGRADVSWQPGGGLPQAKISLSGKGVKATQDVQGRALPVAFDRLDVNAVLEHDRARLDWQVNIAGNGSFNGQVQIADPQGRRNLAGSLTLNNLSLGIINPILERGESAAGTLNANLRVGGSVAQPQLFGQLLLDRVLIRGNWMPFAMAESRLAMNFAGTSSVLQGVIHTTHGQIALAGNADWSRLNAWRAQIAAQGDRVRITVPPMVRLDMSPNIVLEAEPQLFTLNGRVDIPWARILVQELPPSAVGVSPDEVLLDDRLQPIKQPEIPTVINSNLIIHVGDDVRLDAFGLKARLQGDLKMVQDKRGLGLNGQINIPYGRFSAYGQDLIIRRGQLLFAGPPDQPVLNIEAIRNPDSTADNVTAGVRVTGMADQPKLEVFTDPVKSQQEALSYLLRGQGLNTPGADSSAMTSALIGMGVAQSGQLVGKIGSAFGVSNLTLDTQGVGDDSEVVVSGYITPGLQVKYGVGIFDSLATLTLRYRLMPRLYLEAVSGLDQALDLLYQFEF